MVGRVEFPCVFVDVLWAEESDVQVRVTVVADEDGGCAALEVLFEWFIVAHECACAFHPGARVFVVVAFAVNAGHC